MLDDSDGSVHLETNGQTFISFILNLLQSLWTLASDLLHILWPIMSLPPEQLLSTKIKLHKRQHNRLFSGQVESDDRFEYLVEPNVALPPSLVATQLRQHLGNIPCVPFSAEHAVLKLFPMSCDFDS
jgi:hypothetical protein